MGRGPATCSRPNLPSSGGQCSSPPTPPAHAPVFGSGWLTARVGRGAGYTADSLALLTGRKRAYGYRYTEAFLSQVAYADGADSFTSALACWSTQLWHPPQALAEDTAQPHTLTCYVDGHRKPVYSDVLLPRGLIGRMPRRSGVPRAPVAARRARPSLGVPTHRGDQHLTVGVPVFLERYEQHAGNSQVTRMIVDREGMATAFLARLHAQGRHVVTILQTNQYRDLSSFSGVGAFVPLSRNTHGQLIREVAPARISLPREEAPYPSRWDSDLPAF